MENWYCIENDIKIGPCSLAELKRKQIERDTLVWTDGMEDWDHAGNITLLKDIFVSIPPPTPKERAEQKKRTVHTDAQEETEETDEHTENKKNIKSFSNAQISGFFLIALVVYKGYTIYSRGLDDISVVKEMFFSIIMAYNLVILFRALKRYLNVLNGYFKADNLIGTIIAMKVTSIILYAVFVLFFHENGNSILEYSGFTLWLICDGIILALMIRLLGIENDHSGLLLPFSIILILSEIISAPFAVIGYWTNDVTFVLVAMGIFCIPYIVLLFLFQRAIAGCKEKG